MVKRHIRLKETLRGLDDYVTPPDDYILRTDRSLEQKPYRRRTTNQGFLYTGVEPVKERSSVFFLGGSFVEGMYSDEERRFVAQVARKVPANVYNGGYSGTTSIQMSVMLISKIGGLARPGDSVVLAMPMSDIHPATVKGSYWNDSRSYAVLAPPENSGMEPSIDHTRAAFESMIAFCRTMKIKVAIMTGPRRQSDFNSEGWSRLIYRRDRKAYETAGEVAQKLNEAVRGVAEKHSIPVVDLDRRFSSQSHLFYDHMHLNHEGQDAVASYLVPRIEKLVGL